MSIKFYDSSYFSLQKVSSLKKDKKIYIIFSTYGIREEELIFDKVSLLKSGIGCIIDKIFLSHRRMDITADEITEYRAREADPDLDVIISNSIAVPDMEEEKGKGADMRRALYYINKNFRGSADGKDIIIVFLDTDVVTEYFGVHFVLGLAGAVLEGSDFAKASFWREMGRVKKYVARPLFSLISHPALEKLSDFAYPLSGEVAGTLDFFNSVNFWQLYGVETGINLDACFGNYKISDVNLGLYDHKHHDDAVIQKMSFGVIRTFFLQLIEKGIIELKDNAFISDFMKDSYIDENGKRNRIEYGLNEKKYKPLKMLL